MTSVWWMIAFDNSRICSEFRMPQADGGIFWTLICWLNWMGVFVSGVGGGDGISSFATSMAVPSSVLAGTSSGSSLEGSVGFSFAIIPKNIKHATPVCLCQISMVRRCWSCFQYKLRFIAVNRYVHIRELRFDCFLVFVEPKSDLRPIVRRYAWGHVNNHTQTATLKLGLGRHIDRTI